MDDPASALAELMNQRRGNHAADPSHGASSQNPVAPSDPPATAAQPDHGFHPRNSARTATAGANDTRHIESIAALVCELLGARVKPWLTRKLRDWPHVLEDADDLGQLAALAFVEGYRQGRVEPDREMQRHTASSVSAYLWGICNHIFIDTLRRNRPAAGQREVSFIETSRGSQESSPLEKILLEAPEEEDEARLWGVLTAVRSRCRPKDIVLTYLLGCGFSSGEIRRLLESGVNMPARAIKRVGLAVREVLALDRSTQLDDSQAGASDTGSGSNGASSNGGTNRGPSPLSALGLLLQRSFAELVQLLDSTPARNMFLREAVAALGPAGKVSVEQSLADRRYEIRANGDWSWGLLSPGERRELLLRDARLLRGAGIPDEGAAQRAALKNLVADLGSIFEELDQALLGDDLNWLLPLAEHLHVVLGIISEFKEMQQRYRALLEAARRLHSPRLEMTAQLGLGSALTKLGEYSEAREVLERAVGLARENSEPRVEGLALSALADVYSSLGDRSHATELYEQCLPILRAIGDRHGEGAALDGLALNLRQLGNYDSAEELLGKALEIRREIGDRHGIASSLNLLGSVQHCRGKWDAARELYAESLAIMREIGDRYSIATSLNTMAVAECAQGNYHAAREMHAEALAIRREIRDRQGIARSISNLAYVEWSLCNYESARELYTESLIIRREIDDRSGLATDLGNLGLVEASQFNFDAARELYEESLAIKREIGERRGVARTLSNLGIVERSQGNFDAARKLYIESLAIRREIGNRSGIAVSLSNLGTVEWSLGNYDAARELHGEVLTISRELGLRYGIALSLVNLGDVETSQSNFDGARKLYTESLAFTREIGNRTLEGASLHGLAMVHLALKQHPQARESLEKAIAIRREIGDRSGIYQSLAVCAALLASCDLLSPAALCAQGALHHAEELNCRIEQMERELLEQALEKIEHPETGLAAIQREKLTAQAEAMSLDELAEFALAKLAELRG